MTGVGPALSIVVVCDRIETIAKSLDRLRRQTAAGRCELVVVAPPEAELDLGALGREPFAAVQVVRVERLVSLAAARAEGVRAASAPLVGFVESHSYPAPEWVDAMIAAHAGAWAAVGPAIVNANPGCALSWAGLLLDYGRWIEPSAGGELDDLPGHNSSYKRQLLLAFGSRLETLLESEAVLHRELRGAGHRLWLESRARVEHLNVTRLNSWIWERFAAGRHFAAARASGWRPGRRVLYAVGSPLIPWVRLVRLLPVLRRCAARRRLPALTLPALGVSLVASAAGELVGYALGGGRVGERLWRMELHKERHLAAGDAYAR